VLSLKWEDVNLPGARIIVTSPKTAYLEAKANRVVPIFTALRPYLEDTYELAETGELYVVGGKDRRDLSHRGGRELEEC